MLTNNRNIIEGNTFGIGNIKNTWCIIVISIKIKWRNIRIAMTERKEIYRTNENKNCHRIYKAGSSVVCRILLWDNDNNIAWDKPTHVVPYMVVERQRTSLHRTLV